MKSKNIIITILLSIPLILSAGTTGKITGTVTDAETGLPLPGVNIIVEGTILGAATDFNGSYFITNLSAGTYTISALMIGYKKMVSDNVRISVDLTTTQNFALEPTVLEGEEIIVEAERPLIQQDITSSRTIQSGDDIIRMPVDDYTGALTTIAGAVVEDGNLHIRGGREAEVTYLLDNTSMVDPLSGNNDSEITNFAIEETHVMTGGFSAEYGNAQSGIVNVVTKDGGNMFNGRIRYTTSDYGLSSDLSTVRTDEVAENRNRVEVSFSGPEPLLSRLLPLPGRMTYIITGDYLDTQGRFLNQDKIASTFLGKLTYRPIPQFTIRLNGLLDRSKYNYFSRTSESYGTLWKRTVYEDRQVKYEFRDDNGNGENDNRNYIPGWYSNGILDSEDANHNGILDFVDINGDGEWNTGEPTEDLNGNGVLDREDLDHNGKIDQFNMVDHLSDRDLNSNQFGFYIMHQLSQRTFYEFKIHRYYTRRFHNADEIINEDIDGDGKLDLNDEWIQAQNGVYHWVDLDNDGYFDHGNEDLNGNGILDEYGVDLFTDRNNNGYVDASEIGTPPRDYYTRMGEKDPESQWMNWADIPYQGQKDYDGFYTYGAGTTWDRRSWYEDESEVYGLKFDFDSQISDYQRLRAGLDVQLQNIFRYDATDRYGYGERFRVKPVQYALYFQDKMESGSMIMNIGLRYDYFDAKWDDYPNNADDPTWDRDEQLFVNNNEDLNSNSRFDEGEDLNGNGYFDQSWIAEKYQIGIDEDGLPVYLVYPGEIKDPRSVPAQDFFSPRFGISYPITENDKMYFSYGRFFSRPTGTSLYRNLRFDMGGGFPVIGNPNLEPEKTTSYEAGVIHAFRSQSTLELKGFFKNVTGLVDSRPIYFNVRDWYAFYYNNDYGTIRGFELTYTQRPLPLRFFSAAGVFTYTFQVAKNKSSDTWEGYYTEWAGNIHPTEETFTDWDQRHTINMNLDLRTYSQMGPVLGNWSANFLFRYGSGTRWTPPRGQDRSALENTRVMPAKYTLDARFGKLFSFGRDVDFEFIIDVRNLFDRKNVVNIADEEWYAADQDGDGEPDYDPQGKYNNPTVYDRGRLVRVILQTNF